RSGPGHRRDRRGWRCTAAEWLSPGVAFVQAVPVADLALAVFPAEVDLTPVAEVQEVDQAETDVLGRAAEFDDLAQPPTDLAGQPLDLGLVSAPGPTVENAAAGHGDPLLLGLHPLLRRAPAVCRRRATPRERRRPGAAIRPARFGRRPRCDTAAAATSSAAVRRRTRAPGCPSRRWRDRHRLARGRRERRSSGAALAPR